MWRIIREELEEPPTLVLIVPDLLRVLDVGLLESLGEFGERLQLRTSTGRRTSDGEESERNKYKLPNECRCRR